MRPAPIALSAVGVVFVIAVTAFFVSQRLEPDVTPAAPVMITPPAIAPSAAGAQPTTTATTTASTLDRGRGAGPTDAPGGDAVVPTTPGATTTTTTTTTAGVARAPAATCEARLEGVQAELTALVKRREELEGKPIPARDDVAPRFASAGLLSTFQRGFAQSGVKGQVESVDCSEHPCIILGRLEGDEAEVAKLEDSAVFSAYDDDIGVMLTWASGHGGHDDDHGSRPGGGGREKPAEVSLFAFAFYGVDEEARSEQIDRRIRTRTAEYWNASRPRE